MGLGWWIWNEGDNAKNPPFGHTGGSEGFSTSLTFIKERETAVVILTNAGSYSPSEISNEIFRGNWEEEI